MSSLLCTSRRAVLACGMAAAAILACPALASSRRALPRMTEGPFYPPASYRTRQIDWDADLTRISDRGVNGAAPPRAAGEYLDLRGLVADSNGRIVDGAEIEIWQCDAYGSYRHPRDTASRVDEAFQGFGASRTDARGAFRFRTIRPVPYPGRTPHIHVKLRHPSFGEITSQWFIAGDPGNEGDFLYRRLSAAEHEQTDIRLQRAASGTDAVWSADRPVVVEA